MNDNDPSPQLRELAYYEALPCPFCGAQPEAEDLGLGDVEVFCPKPGCSVQPVTVGRNVAAALDGWNRRVPDEMGGECDWSPDNRLRLFPSYYDDAEKVHGALLLCGDAEAELAEVQGWSALQRKTAAEWALALYTAASDNDDVVVPPRPEFVRRGAAWAARNPVTGEPAQGAQA